MELNEKEAHCVARLLQGGFYGNNVLNGCTFCKFKCRPQLIDDEEISMERKIREKFMTETGVDLTQSIPYDIVFSEFPYKKFLKNSNEGIKEHLRKAFADI